MSEDQALQTLVQYAYDTTKRMMDKEITMEEAKELVRKRKEELGIETIEKEE